MQSLCKHASRVSQCILVKMSSIMYYELLCELGIRATGLVGWAHWLGLVSLCQPSCLTLPGPSHSHSFPLNYIRLCQTPKWVCSPKVSHMHPGAKQVLGDQWLVWGRGVRYIVAIWLLGRSSWRCMTQPVGPWDVSGGMGWPKLKSKMVCKTLNVGDLAQMVERSLSMWEARGSIPRFSIIF